MARAMPMMPVVKSVTLGLLIALTASCAREAIPTAYKGLNDHEMSAALSNTTILYQRRLAMVFEFYGADGLYREWSSSRDTLKKGTWSVSDGHICQHFSNKETGKIVKYCKRKFEKAKDIATVFTGDALELRNREYIFCRIEYRTQDIGNITSPDPRSTIFALTAAAALTNQDSKDMVNRSCDAYVESNQASWYKNGKNHASSVLRETKYTNQEGNFVDIAKFDLIAPDYLTSEGVSVFRRYFQLTNKLTKKGHRSMKGLLQQLKPT